MTDKQIVIDGCNVSGCTRYCADNGKCTAFKSQYLCSERNNCYTKRILKKNKTINILKEKLLRKEQECEELKDEILHLRKEGNKSCAYCADLIAKEQESEELKETFDGLFKVQYQLADSNKKLRECLTEIKEIAENMNKECFYCDFRCADCDFKNGCTYQARKQILQKISEVENG